MLLSDGALLPSRLRLAGAASGRRCDLGSSKPSVRHYMRPSRLEVASEAPQKASRGGAESRRYVTLGRWRNASPAALDKTDAPWLSWKPSAATSQLLSCTHAVCVLGTLGALQPGRAVASEAVPVELFGKWLDTVESLGPLGPFLFVLAFAAAEMIPLAPTQPLSLASGLAFGAFKGAACVLAAVSTAGILAFTLARTVGKPWASRLVKEDLGDRASARTVQASIDRVRTAIEQGSFWQQCTAVTLLRLTPVIPFSASNYLLGFTPLGYGPFITGTLAGMSVWSLVYASIGGAGRSLLQQGQADLGQILQGLADSAAGYSKSAAVIALVLGLVAAASWVSGLSDQKSP